MAQKKKNKRRRRQFQQKVILSVLLVIIIGLIGVLGYQMQKNEKKQDLLPITQNMTEDSKTNHCKRPFTNQEQNQNNTKS